MKGDTTKPNSTDSDSSVDYLYHFKNYCDDNSFPTLAVFNISFTIFGLVTGFFLVTMIMKNAALRGDKFLLLNHLIGVAIVLLAMTGLLYTEEAINPCWSIGRFLCKMVHFLKTSLTNVSTFLLVCLAIQQLNRYRRKTDNFFNATHQRWLITVAGIWCFAIVVSVPELVLSNVLHFDQEGVLSFCGVYNSNLAQGFTLSAKILFVEYISPFLILVLVVIITSFYVFMVRSQYTTFGVTAGESLVVRDLKQPKHFALVICLAFVYTIGYFPLYSYELASFKEGLFQTGRFSKFWLHMDLVSTFFVLVPPALVPLFVLLFSWPHRDTVIEIYRGITVTIFDDQTRETGAAAEKQEEFADVNLKA